MKYMNKTIITVGAIGMSFLFLFLILFFSAIGDYNTFSKLENKIEAVQKDNENILDNTRKAIRETAKVSDKEIEALENIIVGNSQARGQNTAGEGQAVTMNWVQEAVPSIQNIQTLKNLQNIIIAGRKDWQNAQTRLLDLKRESDNMLDVFPSGNILRIMGKKPVDIIVVTSSETENNFKNGKDDSSWIE